MIATIRLGLVALLCAASAGCVFLPAVAAGVAAQTAPALVVLGLGPMVAMQERSQKDRCQVFTDKGISVTESLETGIPTDEGAVERFEPAYWRPEFAREGYPETERSRTPTEGTLVLGERSILFVPLPGAARIRIPYELVQDVAIRGIAAAGETRSLVVRSCSGRFDIVTFREPDAPGPDASTTAAARLEARRAAFHLAARD